MRELLCFLGIHLFGKYTLNRIEIDRGSISYRIIKVRACQECGKLEIE